MFDPDADLDDLPELGIVTVSATSPDRILTAAGTRSLPWRSVALDFHGIDPEPVRQLQGLTLPPVQSRGIAMIAAGHLLRLREGQRGVVAVENAPCPRAPRTGELNDGQFLREVAEIADCGIVLDLDRPLPVCGASRRDLLGVFDSLPAQRVIAVRVSIHQIARRKAVLSALVARVPRLRAILVTCRETGTEYETPASLVRLGLEAIWKQRGRARDQARPNLSGPELGNTVSPPQSTPYPDTFSRSSRLLTGRRQRGSKAFPFQG